MKLIESVRKYSVEGSAKTLAKALEDAGFFVRVKRAGRPAMNSILGSTLSTRQTVYYIYTADAPKKAGAGNDFVGKIERREIEVRDNKCPELDQFARDYKVY